MFISARRTKRQKVILPTAISKGKPNQIYIAYVPQLGDVKRRS